MTVRYSGAISRIVVMNSVFIGVLMVLGLCTSLLEPTKAPLVFLITVVMGLLMTWKAHDESQKLINKIPVKWVGDIWKTRGQVRRSLIGNAMTFVIAAIVMCVMLPVSIHRGDFGTVTGCVVAMVFWVGIMITDALIVTRGVTFHLRDHEK